MAPLPRRVLAMGVIIGFGHEGGAGSETLPEPSNPQEPPELVPLLCEPEQLRAWHILKKELRTQVPRFSTRLPFALYKGDMPFLDEVQSLIVQLGVSDGLLAGSEVPEAWSECALGLLCLRMMLLLTQVTSLPSHSPRAVVRLLPQVLTSPWPEVLLSDWPLFSLVGVISRWASPHANARFTYTGGTHSRAAAMAAKFLGRSACDAAEFGAVARARVVLGRLWRHPDPTIAMEGEGPPLETALAGLQGAVWGGDAGTCRWTEHLGRYLGRSTGQAQGTLLAAMAACDAEPACAGVTVRDSGFELREGDPMLEVSPTDEHSYVRWCTAEDCPFPRAIGLLARALRELLGDRGLDSFAPELIWEAQRALAGWAGRVGQATAGLEAWTTEWPLWQLLARLQLRLELLRSTRVGGGTWAGALQRAVGFGDEAWRLAVEELSEVDTQLPASLREGVGCSNGRQCVAELYARLHLLLHGSGRLPLRDPIFMQPDDMLAPAYMERGNALVDGIDYDWGKMVQEGKEKMTQEGSEEETRAEALDRLIPNEHPLQVDRRQLAHFVLHVRDQLEPRQLGRCLEWDQPFILVRAFQSFCRWFDIFSYSEPSPDDPRMGLPGRHEYTYGTRHYWGDLEHAEGMGIEPDTFDLILCPFVFEHVSRPFLAMRNLAKVLRSGGHIIWAAPMFQQYHGSPHDYFRYTPNGARSLAADAGLEVVSLYAPGDQALATGVMLGMMMPYWTEQQVLREVEPEPKEDSPRHPLNVFALMRKPPLKRG